MTTVSRIGNQSFFVNAANNTHAVAVASTPAQVAADTGRVIENLAEQTRKMNVIRPTEANTAAYNKLFMLSTTVNNTLKGPSVTAAQAAAQTQSHVAAVDEPESSNYSPKY